MIRIGIAGRVAAGAERDERDALPDRLLQKAPQALGRGPVPAKPCALPAEIDRKLASGQAESRNEGVEKERLKHQEVIGYEGAEAASSSRLQHQSGDSPS